VRIETQMSRETAKHASSPQLRATSTASSPHRLRAEAGCMGVIFSNRADAWSGKWPLAETLSQSRSLE
jgi:hypothetical protein